MGQNEKSAVIFDMDGVLVDSYRPHYLSWVRTCDARGITITPEKFAELFGRSFRAFAEELCPYPLPEREMLDWYDEKESCYRDVIEKDFPAMDGADDLIGHLGDAGFIAGIASSGPRGNVDCVLNHLKNAERITATVSADDTTHAKPHPEVFLRCAEKLNVPSARCVVIEDSLHGLQAGRAAGMKTIALAGTLEKDVLAPFADLVVASLRSLNFNIILNLLTCPVR